MKRKIKKAICLMILLAYAITFGNNTALANTNVKYDNIDNQLKRELDELHIPGMAVAIVDSKEVLLAETYGNCKSIDTPFIIGSVSKSFTALAIMRLVEEDKIDLDEKISAYIAPSAYFINESDGNKITVRQLLNQTGGLKGNRGNCYHDIEIGTTDDLLFAQNVNDVKIDNLCLKYASRFAVNFGNNKEILVSNCEIAWIGGADFNDSIRYGNGVQFWYRGEDILVRHCLIHQVFDAALTFQGSGSDRAIFKNIVFEENLIEYCSMNIEFWAGEDQGPKPKIQGIRIRDNIIRFGGYGWGGLQRPDLGDQALLMAWGRHYEEFSDFQITGNVFDCADCNLIWMLPPDRQEGLLVSGNNYYQSVTSGRNPEIEVVRGSGLYAGCQEELEQAVKYFEKKPGKVVWVEKER